MNQPNSNLPYEKFRNLGPENLTDEELLAIILRTGTRNKTALELANEVLQKADFGKSGLLGLHQISLKQLSQIKGIGPVKAVKIKCITELSKRIAAATARSSFTFQTSGSVAAYMMEKIRHLTREEVHLLLLDAKGHLMKDFLLSTGTVNISLLSPREVFIEALNFGAVQFIVAHNHPSGDPTPSADDKKVTDTLFKLGNQLELPLIDHIIIGDNRYFSFKEHGLL